MGGDNAHYAMTCETVLTPAPVTLREEDTVARAVQELIQRRLLIVPVLDERDRLIGLFGVQRLVELLLPTAATAPHGLADLSFVGDRLEDFRDKMGELAGHLLGEHIQRRLHDIRDHPLREYLHDEPVVVHPNTPLTEALLLLYHSHSTLPVVEEEAPGRFLGIISYWHVLERLSARTAG